MASPPPERAPAAEARRRRTTVYHGHRRPSPHRPTVRGGVFSYLRATTAASSQPRPPSSSSSSAPFRLADWDPSSSSSSSTPSPSATAAARRLSPLARFLLDALRRHQRWGPPVVAELTKLRRVAPELVAEVLSARPPPPPPLALPFFLWAGRQKGFRHCFPAFHALASLLSAAGLPAAADQLPDLMRAHGKPVSHSQLNLLVRLHTGARRPLRALHALRRFRHEFSVQPEVHACNRVLGALAAAGHVDDTLKLFDEMSHCSVRPMPVTFAIMVRALARAGMTDKLLEMIGRMRAEVCRPDVFVYTALVKTMVRWGHMEGCIRVWEEMRRDHVDPDTMAYTTMIAGLCNAGMVEKAEELFGEMRRKGLLVDRMVYASLIDGYVSTGRVSDGCRVLKEMVDAGYRADLGIYNTLIGGLCEIEREDKAHKMFQIVVQEDLIPSSETVSPLLARYADKGEMVKFFGLVDKLVELSLPIVEILVDFLKLFACKSGNELKAVEVFNAFRRRGHYSVGIYNILIENLLKIKERKKALVLFEEMQSSDDCKPDSCFFFTTTPGELASLDEVKKPIQPTGRTSEIHLVQPGRLMA
uniref:Pentacotripeptide-repeat region of PRORP domain-containing protein n=1 Tax=Oryza nivara TaxID=4536 RepID=A0A0E0HXC8_ORYNI